MFSSPLFVTPLQLRQPSLKCFAEDMDFYSAQVLLAIAGAARPDSSKGCRKQGAFLQTRHPGTDFHLGAMRKQILCNCSLSPPRTWSAPQPEMPDPIINQFRAFARGGILWIPWKLCYVKIFLRTRSWLKDRNSKPCPHWGREKPEAALLSSWLPFPVENTAENEAEIIKSEERELQKNLKETRLHQLHHSDSNLFSQLPK